MKLKGQLTLLFDHNGMDIEVRDPGAASLFLKLRLDAKQTCQVMSRLGYTPCEMEVFNLDHVGKIHEHQSFEFKIGKIDSAYSTLNKRAADAAKKACPAGWTPDLGFNSQSSFFRKDDEQWARTIIRRWVEKGESDVSA